MWIKIFDKHLMSQIIFVQFEMSQIIFEMSQIIFVQLEMRKGIFVHIAFFREQQYLLMTKYCWKPPDERILCVMTKGILLLLC